MSTNDPFSDYVVCEHCDLPIEECVCDFEGEEDEFYEDEDEVDGEEADVPRCGICGTPLSENCDCSPEDAFGEPEID